MEAVKRGPCGSLARFRRPNGEGSAYEEITETGQKKALQKAQITLNDCLACSGCITSAEHILITEQSQDELYSVLKGKVRAVDGEGEDF